MNVRPRDVHRWPLALLLAGCLNSGCTVNEDDADPADGGTPDASPCDVENPAGIEWIYIEGGEFLMGDDADPTASPRHRVTVPSFYIAQTETTWAQWTRCPDCFRLLDRRDPASCIIPEPAGEPDLVECVLATDDQPISIHFEEASRFAAWAGGALPSEAQWEFAARSGGMDIRFPWGNEPATCELASLTACIDRWGNSACSRPGGNTAQGVCDMVGNYPEWMLDIAHRNYEGAPTDGSAWTSGGNVDTVYGDRVEPDEVGVVRSGHQVSSFVTQREFAERRMASGFRLVRPVPPGCVP